MSTRFYDTDLTDAAWAFVAPVLPAARTGGRPRTTNLRAVLNAIFYLLRTGCQWRLLPREFPPCGTVYHYFQAWQNSAVWVHLHRVVYEQARRHTGRAACPSVVIMDGQSVKTTERGGARGFYAHKRVKGPKRHILVDTLGLLVANRVEPADTSDRRVGRSAAWRIECIVSEDPDGNSRGRLRKPQARSNPETTPRMAATDRQETTTSVQNHGSDLDR